MSEKLLVNYAIFKVGINEIDFGMLLLKNMK